MDYLIKTGDDIEGLVLNVRLGIKYGFKPIGGVYSTDDEDSETGRIWVQAMVSDKPLGFAEYADSVIGGCDICGDIGCNPSLHGINAE